MPSSSPGIARRRRREGAAVTPWLLLLVLGAKPAEPSEAPAFAWPHGEQAAVSLSYDDAIASQLDNAVPALDRHGLKATFYLTLSSPTLERRLPEWRAVAARGHELGNHTLFHQCRRSLPGREWVSPERDLDHTTATQMLEQVRVGNGMLHAIDGRTERTFTLPCGDRLAAGVDYLPLLRGEFVAMKAGDGGVVADMRALDPYEVGVTAPSGATGADLIALVEQARARGTMINLTFHGIGGDYLSVSTQAHEELLAYLDAHRREVWTDSFIAIMRHVKSQGPSK
jgi:peptidoglycan/xylan/chitin deacetylase (PgdA/CDA1 family)